MKFFQSNGQSILGTLRTTRRQRQRERFQTKGLISKIISVHVHFLPFSAKQQREMTKFCFVWRAQATRTNFFHFYLELNAFVAYSAGASFNTERCSGWFQINSKFQSKIETHFFKTYRLGCHRVINVTSRDQSQARENTD